ncbi:hypothetical protein JCM8097_009040 [Rhodosporidiobolus ruineniae]
MSSSASTAYTPDEVMKGGDDVQEDSVGEVKPQSPFDRLPDEVVIEILRSALPNGHWDTSAGNMLVNKRIYALSRELRFAHYFFSKLNNGIIGQHDVIGDVKSVEYWTSRSHPQAVDYEGRMLSLFRNITSLTVKLLSDVLDAEDPSNGTEPDEGDLEVRGFLEEAGFPPSFTDSLKLLQHLEYLCICPTSSYRLQDRDFSIAQHLPRLRRLILREPEVGLRFLLTPPPPLSHMTLLRHEVVASGGSLPDLPLDLIPWATLRSLSLNLFSENGISALLGLSSDHPGGLPLCHFHLADPLSSLAAPHSFYLSINGMRRLFELLAMAPLEKAGFHISLALRLPDQVPSLPLVNTLRLHGDPLDDNEVISSANHLSSFLSSFPSLHHLELTHVSFAATSPDVSRLSLDPASDAFTLLYPVLDTFLKLLHKTTLLSLKWRPVHDSELYCWVRSAPYEDFQVDRYREV